MSIELISDLELDGIRADTAQLFEDECTISRKVSAETFDSDSETVTPGTESVIYSGVCSIYPMSARRDRFDVQGQGLIFIRQYRVIIPWDEEDIQIRDIVRATMSSDLQLVGRDLEVRDVFVGTNNGYRRITAHDVEE